MLFEIADKDSHDRPEKPQTLRVWHVQRVLVCYINFVFNVTNFK